MSSQHSRLGAFRLRVGLTQTHSPRKKFGQFGFFSCGEKTLSFSIQCVWYAQRRVAKGPASQLHVTGQGWKAALRPVPAMVPAPLLKLVWRAVASSASTADRLFCKMR